MSGSRIEVPVARVAFLNSQDVSRLKGLAILMIVLHNFFHLIFQKTKENEMDFDPNRFLYFLDEFFVAPKEWIPALFTYFGHLGVQIFIFLSAYGLATAYPRVEASFAFVWSRVKKIYPLFLAAIVAWSLLRVPGPRVLLEVYGLDLGYLLLGVYPLVPGHLYPPMTGPWWFMPFIMQFYVLWTLAGRFICRLSDRGLIVALCVGVAVNYLVVPTVAAAVDINLLATPLGHLPEILLGVICARRGLPTHWSLFFAALVLLMLSGLAATLWPLHHLSALVVFLILLRGIASRATGVLASVIDWYGTYSLPLFLVNGFLRVPFVRASAAYDLWWADLLLGLGFLLFASLSAFLLAKATDVPRRAVARLRTKSR